MRKYTGEIIHWTTRKRSNLGKLIFDRTGDFMKLSEKVKFGPVRKTKRIIVQSGLGRPKGERDTWENSIQEKFKVFNTQMEGI
jgi:hypothetical protein